MQISAEIRKNEVIKKAIKLLRKKPKGKQVGGMEAFVRHFYDEVPPVDIVDESVEYLCGAAVSIHEFAAKRRPKEAKIRAYNPRNADHGWHARHTVVEIINDDMPFLVDSVTSELNRLGVGVHLVIHPLFDVVRDRAGTAQYFQLGRAGSEIAVRESIMHVDIDQRTAPGILRKIEHGLSQILGDVRAAVSDWPQMKSRVGDIINELTSSPPNLPKADVQEAIEFLNWVNDDHFTLLGVRDAEYFGRGRNAKAKILRIGALGVLRDPKFEVFDGLRNLGNLPIEVQEFLRQPHLLRLAKSNRRSTVHRRVHMDTIAIKKVNDRGKVTGEHLLVGLFTSAAYSQSPREIPLLRRKVAEVIRQSGFDPQSHAGKAFQHVVETFPRDELLQIDVEDMLKIGHGVIHLQDRQRIALFARRDAFERFISAFIYIPRDRYSTALRLTFERLVCKAFNGSVISHHAHLTEDTLGRLHLIIKTTPGTIPDYDLDAIKAQLVEASRSWSDRLSDALVGALGEENGNALLYRYGSAFPTAYSEQFSAPDAVFDIQCIENANKTNNLGMNLYRPSHSGGCQVKFKIYSVGTPVTLSGVLPMLENMGLEVISEVPYEVKPVGLDSTIFIHDFLLQASISDEIQVEEVRQSFHNTFSRVWHGDMEDDGFNRLVLRAGLRWRDVVVLRAYCKFLKQGATTFSQEYMEETLATNPDLTNLLVQLFHTRFDPDFMGSRDRAYKSLVVHISKRLDDVQNLDEDRILRRYLNLIQSSLRTNFYHHDDQGEPKPYFSVKFNSLLLDDLPRPRPLREIFVHSPKFEAVHLRFGLVARGGLRWSNRREDFRTEILGLVKAQQVKNAVIVPVGAKGGFILKKAPPASDREGFLTEGIACYRAFISAMLEITDNLDGNKVVRPVRTVRWDDDDPYLVVAADMGTATFSDYANDVAVSHGFWLGDAFASGGSSGYDHKKMGITARGGWESVKRHFRELGHNAQTDDFTAVGVGDMSGDVFGNGMLLSQHIKLVGAFNHSHIFIDPEPDTDSSFGERLRLFAVPHSSWSDYNRKLISRGGGVFARSVKSIPVSPQMKTLFGIECDQITSAQLMKHILLAEADLIWFGGIGTYVKATTENNIDVGDRANDLIRVNGGELRCKVVGEGANLGVTQRGRIEFAKSGGRINTDAIDNSAGVDCSDHEVNIKILLGDVMSRTRMTLKQRDVLLARMTDEVANLVLINNYQQTQAISLTHFLSHSLLDAQQRQMRVLERAGRLERDIEFLPDDEEIYERFTEKQGLTSPEIAVLQAYAKIAVYDSLLDSDLPDDVILSDLLVSYFPTPLHTKFTDAIGRHKLRREIIAEQVTNSIVDRAGSTFVTEMQDRTSKTVPEITRAYIIVREVFELRPLWAAIEALDNIVPVNVQLAMLQQTVKTVERTTEWMLRNSKSGLDIKHHIDEFGPGVNMLRHKLDDLLNSSELADIHSRTRRYSHPGVTKSIAERIGQLKALSSACDIVRISTATKRPVVETGKTYFGVGEYFKLDWLRRHANRLVPENHWHALAIHAILDNLWELQSRLATRVVANNGRSTEPINAWVSKNQDSSNRILHLLAELDAASQVDLAMLTVANQEMQSLLRGGK